MSDHHLNAEISDQPDYQGPIKPYILCTAPRCGSTLLASLLHQTGVMGVPHEYFNPESVLPNLVTRWALPEQIPLETYMEKLLQKRTTPNGIFALKAHLVQFEPLLKNNFFTRFLSVSPCFIHITRKDLIAQAVSYSIAHQTRAWNSQQDEVRKPHYDAKQIDEFLTDILMQNARWERFFALNQITPIKITYEDIIDHPQHIIEMIGKALDLEINEAVNLEETSLKKQGADLNLEWKQRFLDDHAHFRSSANN